VLEQGREVKAATPYGPKVVIVTGDANKAGPLVKLVLPGFPGQRLGLTLVDPYGSSYTWDALSALVLHERMDAMILFPEDMDIERNAGRGDPRFDRFFPSPRWREIVRDSKHLGRDLRDFYKSELHRQQGYFFGDDKTVRNSVGAEIYKLLYASKNKELGTKLWNACTHEDPSGQLQLYLG
jgi:three-Cys-motif partner protein